MKKYFNLSVAALLMLVSGCTASHHLTSVTVEKILIDNRYDKTADAEAQAFLAPYKLRIDSLMSPVVGHTAQALDASRPESGLSNLLSDILVWGAAKYGEQVSFGVYNMGGIRAGFPKGAVTVGNVIDVAPFENKICFLTLTGEQVLKLFSQMAERGGEGVSAAVKMTITANGELQEVTLHGQPINPTARYRIVTIDYLAQGNDGLRVFKQRFDYVAPDGDESNARNIIMAYFKEKELQGLKVKAEVEGRVKLIE